MMGWGGFGWGWIAWLVMILFWLLIAGLAIWLVSALVGSARTSRREPDPRQLLDIRFARGEITEEEYRRAKELLEKQ
jgi:putative membrane protein